MDSSIPQSEIRNPKSLVPPSVARIREQQCRAANCPHELDYTDACAECPEGHWGPNSRDCGQPLPILAQRAKNLAIAIVQEAAAKLSGAPEITEEEALRRQAICFAPCQHLTEQGECSLCGCPMRRKTWWRSQHCQVGKW